MARRTVIRASDIERDAVAERLRRAAAEGRILATELEHRLAIALRARTLGELDAVVADLPGPGRRGVARPTGMQVVAYGTAAVAVVAVLAVAALIIAGLFAAWAVWMIVFWWAFGRAAPPRPRGALRAPAAASRAARAALADRLEGDAVAAARRPCCRVMVLGVWPLEARRARAPGLSAIAVSTPLWPGTVTLADASAAVPAVAVSVAEARAGREAPQERLQATTGIDERGAAEQPERIVGSRGPDGTEPDQRDRLARHRPIRAAHRQRHHRSLTTHQRPPHGARKREMDDPGVAPVDHERPTRRNRRAALDQRHSRPGAIGRPDIAPGRWQAAQERAAHTVAGDEGNRRQDSQTTRRRRPGGVTV